MRTYVKPILSVTRFTSQGTIANDPYDAPTTNETIPNTSEMVPVTTYNIASFSSMS